LKVPRTAVAFWFARLWPIVFIAMAIAATCTSTYCAVGYLHYKHIDEARAVQRAERANADLQNALDRLRDELTASRARIDTLEMELGGSRQPSNTRSL
jgi:hypothetical protein